MQLIDELATGITGAESGSAEFFRYGSTSAVIAVYGDDMGESVLSTPYTLSATGSLVAYVDELCTVIVKNSAGVEVSRFVPKTDASLVSLNSASFTGELTDGTTGVGGTTDLLSAMDLLTESFGAPNFLVRRSGSAIDETLVAAFASIGSTQSIYNIKNYGAVIDGATDDAAAWNAAITAASVAGGIVFHPGGDSYVASSIALVSPKVSILGTSGGYARIKFPSGIGYALAVTCGTANEVRSWIKAIGFTAGSAVTSGAISINSAPGFTVEDVVIDTIAGDSSSIVQLGSRAIFKTCKFDTAASSRMTFSGTGASNTQFIGCHSGANFNYFNGVAAAGVTGLTWIGGVTEAALITGSPTGIDRWGSIGVNNATGSTNLVSFGGGYNGCHFQEVGSVFSRVVNGSGTIYWNAGELMPTTNQICKSVSVGARVHCYYVSSAVTGPLYLYYGAYETVFLDITASGQTLTFDTPGSYPLIGQTISFICKNTSGANSFITFNATNFKWTGGTLTIGAGTTTRIMFVYRGSSEFHQLTAVLNF